MGMKDTIGGVDKKAVDDRLTQLGQTQAAGGAAGAINALQQGKADREAQKKASKEAAEKKKADKIAADKEAKRRKDESDLFGKLSETGVTGKDYYLDKDSGYISSVKDKKPISDDTRKQLIESDKAQRKNVKDINNYATSSVYRAGNDAKDDNILHALGQGAWSLAKSAFGGSQASDGDVLKYLNQAVSDGKILPPEGKKAYDINDVKALKDKDGKIQMAAYNGRIVPQTSYEKSQAAAKNAGDKANGIETPDVPETESEKKPSGNGPLESLPSPEEYWGEGGPSAASVLTKLKSMGKTKEEAEAYMDKLYEGHEKSANLTNAFKDVYKDQAPEQSTANPKENDKVITQGDTELGNQMDSLLNDALDENSRKQVENEIGRMNAGYKNAVDESYAENIPGFFWNSKEFKDASPKQKAFFVTDALATALKNSSKVIKGQEPNEKTVLQQIGESKLKGALDRYNKKQDDMLEADAGLLKLDYQEAQKFKWQLRQLYANKTLQRAIQNLDVDNRKALLENYRKVADSGAFGTDPETIIANCIKISAAQSALEGKLPEMVTQLAGAAGSAVGGAAQSLGAFFGGVFGGAGNTAAGVINGLKK